MSKTNNFTKSHVKYLEAYTYVKASQIGRYEIENNVVLAKPFITESMEADSMDDYDTIKILMSTLGYPIIEEVHNPNQNELLMCKGKDAFARGEYTDDGLVVFKGSTANIKETKTAGPSIINLRNKLINSKVLVLEGNVYIFQSDYIFNSPSAAAAAVLARRANGWKEWKDNYGKTLDALKRI